MGNILHTIAKVSDPGMAALTGGQNDLAYDALTPKQAPGSPPYKGPIPGAQLYAPPPGGPPQDPRFSAMPTSGAGAPSPAGYTPNYFEQQGQASPGPAGSGPNRSVGGPGGIIPFRGGRPSPSGAPGMSNTQPMSGNPDLTRQMAIANMLRSNGGMPSMSTVG